MNPVCDVPLPLGATAGYSVRVVRLVAAPAPGLWHWAAHTVRRGCRTGRTRLYSAWEFPAGADFPGRAFAVGTDRGGRHECRVEARTWRGDCSCAGCVYEASARQLSEARRRTGPGYRTLGCLHLDAIFEFLYLGLIP